MTALITGGASGIGRTAALRLAEKMTVIIADYRLDKAEEIVYAIRESGGNAYAFDVDVSKRESVERLYNNIRQKAGLVDILFNNAGISHKTSVTETTDEEWHRVLDTHVKGTYLCTRIFLPDMCRGRKGIIVNMSSDYAAIGKKYGSAYAAAKTAILAFTKSLAAEFSSCNIRVNAVGPGPIDTPLLRAGREEGQWERFLQERKQIIPIGRIGESKDVADAVEFLCSERSKGINGQMIHINGGRFMN
jgi:3-oxoacyl-[acyl-carrier protein] reductase